MNELDEYELIKANERIKDVIEHDLIELIKSEQGKFVFGVILTNFAHINNCSYLGNNKDEVMFLEGERNVGLKIVDIIGAKAAGEIIESYNDKIENMKREVI